LQLFTTLKRRNIGHGPYSNVSLFEATNRIMSDLVILFDIKHLLNGNIKEISFSKYTVDLGHENTQDHDIMAEENGKKLIGEAFNVSQSLFPIKKNFSLKKLRRNTDINTVKILLYNEDAVGKNFIPKLMPSEFFIAVDLEKELGCT